MEKFFGRPHRYYKTSRGIVYRSTGRFLKSYKKKQDRRAIYPLKKCPKSVFFSRNKKKKLSIGGISNIIYQSQKQKKNCNLPKSSLTTSRGVRESSSMHFGCRNHNFLFHVLTPEIMIFRSKYAFLPRERTRTFWWSKSENQNRGFDT